MSTINAVNNTTQGMVLQTVAISGGGSSISSSTYADVTGSSLTITPTSSSSLILLMMSCAVSVPTASASGLQMRVLRGAGVIGVDPIGVISNQVTGGKQGGIGYAPGYILVDNPATTSPTTYKFQQKSIDNTTSVTSSNLNLVAWELQVGSPTINGINNVTSGGMVQYAYVNGAGSTTSSGTFVDITGATLTITPSSPTNLVLIYTAIYSQVGVAPGNGGANYELLRNGTQILIPSVAIAHSFANQASPNNDKAFFSYLWMDAPNSTVALTYKWQHVQLGTTTIISNPVNMFIAEIET